MNRFYNIFAAVVFGIVVGLIVLVFAAKASAQSTLPLDATFGVDAVATGITSRYKTEPGPVSGLTQVGEDFSGVAMRYHFGLKLNEAHSTEVNVSRNSLGNPSSWYDTADESHADLYGDYDPYTNGWGFKGRQTTIELTHRAKLPYSLKKVEGELSILGGLTFLRFSADQQILLPGIVERGEGEYHHGYIGPFGGGSYSRRFRNVSLNVDATLGVLRQSGAHSYRFSYPTLNGGTRTGSWSRQGTALSLQHHLNIGGAVAITKHFDAVGAYSFRGIRTNDGRYIFRANNGGSSEGNSNNFENGSLSFGLRFRP